MIIHSTIEKQELRLDYIKLAKEMWFKEENGKTLDISHGGNTETLQTIFSLDLSLPKWNYDEQWVCKELNHEDLSFSPVSIQTMKELEFITDHVNILTVDKRAFYIMVLEVTREIQGKISEDNRQTWLTPDEFEQKHQDILSLSYNEANELSLKEAEMIEVIDERNPENWNEKEDQYLQNFWDNLEKHQMTLCVQTKKLGMTLDYRTLAAKMWGAVPIDVIDYDENILTDTFYLALKRRQDFQFINPNYKIPKYCAMYVDEEEGRIDFYTTFTEITTLDQRAMLIFVSEIARLTEGTISEDKGQTWLTLDTFEQKHQAVLSLSYEEAEGRVK